MNLPRLWMGVGLQLLVGVRAVPLTGGVNHSLMEQHRAPGWSQRHLLTDLFLFLSCCQAVHVEAFIRSILLL